MLNLSQNLKLIQKLSPQQIQLIKLLEIPTMELEQRIKREIEENPVLEEGGDERDEEPASTDSDYDMEQRESEPKEDNEPDSDSAMESDMQENYMEETYDEKVGEYSPDDFYDDED